MDAVLPCGWAGTVRSWHELLPGSGRVLRLPEEALVDGPFLRLPAGAHAAVFVTALADGFGNLERFCQSLAAGIADQGLLFLDVANLQAPRALRYALEGRGGTLDPHGSLRNPETPVLPKRLFRALAAAGFLIEDCYAVPSLRHEAGPQLARTLLREGFLAVGYIPFAPPARLWLCCRRTAARAGSIVIGTGPVERQERTAGAVRAFLPGDWEIVTCSGDHEREGFDRALPQARGEVLWWLRAGATPGGAAFERLLARTVIGPAAPARDGELLAPGDVSGLMASRLDLLLAGPLPREWRSDAIAYEEYGLRLESLARSIHPVEVEPGDFASPPLGATPLSVLKPESEAMLERWTALGREPRHTSDDDPHRRAAARPPPPWQGRAPRISLCMIAKNEERFLPECLRRAAPAVDEIVLVDTGSTDRTIAIAESFGARILRTTWDDDFATPRNLGLEAATGDWILVLDADEMLADDAPARLRELCRDAGVGGYHLHLQNVYAEGKTAGVLIVRLFRRLPGVVFQNCIHEQVTPSLLRASLAEGLILSIADVKVDHLGYSEEVIQDRGKDARNERIFQKQLAAHPDDYYTLYKFGDFLRRWPARQDEARGLLQRALDTIDALPPQLPREIPYAGEIAALLALEWLRQERHDAAEQVVENALRRFVPTPNLHYIAASLALARGRNDEAILHFERCLSYRDQALVVPIQEGVTSWVAIAGIAQAHLARGDRARGRRLLEQALAQNPRYEVATLLLSRTWLESGEPGRSLQVLMDHLQREPDSAGALQQATLILAKLGLAAKARAFGERALVLLERRERGAEAERMRQTLAALV